MSSVRFGNVIGSSGSVLNQFTKLISQRKNITVTHPKVSRFFMSIKEACYLVLLSVKNSQENHQVFMLDMGDEIYIKDIAEKLIQLNGLVVGEDIKVLYSQLEKGEKLSEKLNYKFEQSFDTEISKLIRLDSNKEIANQSIETFMKNLSKLIYNKEVVDSEIANYIDTTLEGLV
jgi:FlaA1/EpsC-like NDP-sugar epimerase